jgi:hypothetical protein
MDKKMIKKLTTPGMKLTPAEKKKQSILFFGKVVKKSDKKQYLNRA